MNKNFISIQRAAQKLMFPSFRNIFYEINILYLCKLELHRLRWLSTFSKAFRKIHGFFNKQHFYRLKLSEIKQMLIKPWSWTFAIWKLFTFFSHVIIRKWDILKNKQTGECVCIHEIIQLIIMKIKMKIKKRFI